MKRNKYVLILIFLFLPSVVFADKFDRYQLRYEMIKKSNQCVEKVRRIEFNRNPDKFPVFDVYSVIPKTRFSKDATDIDKEAYEKCMKEN